MIKSISAAAFAALVAIGTCAEARPVYSNLPATYNGGWGLSSNGTTQQFAAEDFILAPGDTTINGASWYGHDFPNYAIPPGGTFSLAIHSDASGVPAAAELFSFEVSPIVTSAPTNVSFTILLTAAFAPVTLNAGQTYWLSIAPNFNGQMVWAGENTGGNAALFNEFNGSNEVWRTQSSNLGFNILAPDTATVPLPSSGLLVALGFLILAATRRRPAA